MRRTLGNLGADLILADLKNPLHQGGPPPSRHALLDDLHRIKDLGFDAIEDYVGWRVIEPEPGKPDLTRHLEHRTLVEQAGLEYVIYPWVHAVPPWAEDHEWVVRAVCLEHDQETCGLSLFAPETEQLFDHVYRIIKRELGVPDGVTIALPNDYGEVGYPVGFGAWALTPHVDETHAHIGYWCGDGAGRRSYRESLVDRFGDVATINRTLHTSFHGEGAIQPPQNPDRADLPPRLRDHFIHWYQDSVTRFVDRALTRAHALFPTARLAFKCGYAGENAAYGISPHDLAQVAKSHQAELWSTHGGLPVVFHKRYQGLCRTLGVDYITEAVTEPDRTAVLDRLFEDASEGVSGVFEFHESFLLHEQDFQRHLPKVRSSAPIVDVAILFRETALAREPGLAYPPGLTAIAEPLRDLLDFEVLDEATVQMEGALSRHKVLAIPDPGPMARGSLDAIVRFAESGGVLVVPAGDGITDLSGTVHHPALAVQAPNTSDLFRWAEPASGSPVLRFDGSDEWQVFGQALQIEAASPYFGDSDFGDPDARCRWIGSRAGFRIPATHQSNAESSPPQRIKLQVFAPPDARPDQWRITIQGIESDARLVSGAQTLTLLVPENATPSPVIVVECHGPSFRPGYQNGREDHRDLGLLLLEARIGDGPPNPGESLAVLVPEVCVDAARLSFSPLGNGGVLHAPERDPLALAFLIHHACARHSTLLPGSRDLVVPPANRAGIRVTRFADRLLIYNRSTQEQVLRWPEALAAPLALAPGEIREMPYRPPPGG